ncbi:MAG: Dam family site-specific DNA-(adenine-N6)-methyltransferase [Chloroflexi bacterium]|nr:Dam family site-specific DNA-(adenine-N6)-methyltransferase [Chloroflexota bacterium]
MSYFRLNNLPFIPRQSRTYKARPVLKWAGGKQWLVKYLPMLVPKITGNYAEPFLGGAAIYFSLQPDRPLLADSNEELVNFYEVLRDSPGELVREVGSYQYDKSFYYQLRASLPSDKVNRAARFLYLNKTCWNGLYRVNQKGAFNVPIGRYKEPLICDARGLLKASAVLQSATLVCGDFEDTTACLSSGDFVYLDPPYVANQEGNGFLKYNGRVFSWKDQLRLADVVHRLDKRGVLILITNTCHPSVLDLYRDFYSCLVDRASRIAGRVERRRQITECVITNYDITAGVSA